jgi:myo-inositol-1(or 4)-monophosphatase
MSPTLDEVKDMAYKAGEILGAGYGQVHQVHMKGLTDPVTEVDKKSEESIISTIRKKFPDHSIVAEESGIHTGTDGARWHIDPLDGTVNFAHGLAIFSVSIAFEKDGEIQLGVVYDPMRDELFSAERGKGAWLNGKPIHVSNTGKLIRSLSVTGLSYDHDSAEMMEGLELFKRFSIQGQACRRLGSAALNMSYVACGRMDFYFELVVQTYDVAAGILLVQEAGGTVSKKDGSPDCLTPPWSMVASNKILHPQILEIIRQE